MDVLRTAVSALAYYDARDRRHLDRSHPAQGCRGCWPSSPPSWPPFSATAKASRPWRPDPTLGHAANFLYMLHGEPQSDLQNDAMNLYLVLLADHSLNASTFTARVAASTNADLHAAITAAIGALKGNLHGGAAEATMNMLLEIGAHATRWTRSSTTPSTPSARSWASATAFTRPATRAPPTCWTWPAAWSRPRATAHNYVDMAQGRGEAAVLAHRELYPNVDFFSAPMLYYLGIPTELDTCVFAVSRVAGWTAHVIEQYEDATLIRPGRQVHRPQEPAFRCAGRARLRPRPLRRP